MFIGSRDFLFHLRVESTLLFQLLLQCFSLLLPIRSKLVHVVVREAENYMEDIQIYDVIL